MRTTWRNGLTVIAAAVFCSLGVMNHVAALAGHSANSNSSHHTNSMSCASLCMTLPAKEQEASDSTRKDDEDEPDFPRLEQRLVLTGLSAQHSRYTRLLVDFEPPPGDPAYIQYGVYRV